MLWLGARKASLYMAGKYHNWCNNRQCIIRVGLMLKEINCAQLFLEQTLSQIGLASDHRLFQTKPRSLSTSQNVTSHAYEIVYSQNFRGIFRPRSDHSADFSMQYTGETSDALAAEYLQCDLVYCGIQLHCPKANIKSIDLLSRLKHRSLDPTLIDQAQSNQSSSQLSGEKIAKFDG